MKKLLIVITLIALSAIPAVAQTSTRIHPLTAEGCVGKLYTVVDGDRLYKKYGPAWDQLIRTNSGLSQRIKKDADGTRTIAWLYPSRHDVLCIPADMSVGDVITHNTGTSVPTPTPQIDDTNDKVSLAEVVTASTPWYLSYWVLVPIALLFLAMAYYFGKRLYEQREAERIAALREHELTRDPVTSGQPIVAGGIPPTDRQRLYDHFEDQAVASYVRATPGANAETARPNIVRIGVIERGMISGEGMVGYADHARPRRINPAQPGYRARFRFPDGSERELMSLQGCMNPVFVGEGMTGFTFTPGHVAVPVPEPPAPAPTAVPHPAIAMARIRAAAEGEGRSTLTIGDQTITFDRGVHLEVDEVTGAVRMNGSAFDMTIRPKRRKANRVGRATGTDSK